MSGEESFEIGLYRSDIHRGTWTAVMHGGVFDESHMVRLCGPLRTLQAAIRGEFGDGAFSRLGPNGYIFKPAGEVEPNG